MIQRIVCIREHVLYIRSLLKLPKGLPEFNPTASYVLASDSAGSASGYSFGEFMDGVIMVRRLARILPYVSS